jgi:excisionase family DNA binding protein
MLTAAELGDLLGFEAGTIVDWAEAGKIPAFKLGGRLRFRESEVLPWLEDKRKAVGPGAGGGVLTTPTALPTHGVASQVLTTPNRGGSHAG